MKTRLARALLVFALLLAQQAGLAHQLWHATLGVPQAAATVAGNESSGGSLQEGLCDLHSALGTVLGALGSSSAAPVAIVLPTTGFAVLRASVASLAAPAPASRDPPRLG